MAERFRVKLFALLHDVGKVFVRAGRTRDDVREGVCRAFAEGGGYAHDALSCQFIADSFGREYAEAFVKEKRLWELGDWASATERVPGERANIEVSNVPLLDPVFTSAIILKAKREGKSAEEELKSRLDGLKREKAWRPVVQVDFGAPPNVYYLRDYEEARKYVNYPKIAEELEGLGRTVGKLKGDRARLVTMDAVLRYLTLFVPAAVYETLVPDTSLYGHSRLAAAVAGNSSFRLLFIDIKGIQRFISSVSGEANAAKRLRGRSFFLQLLQEAIMAWLTAEMGVTQVDNLVFEPGKFLFVVPPDFDEGRLREKLRELSEWLDYQVQFTVSLSEEIGQDAICFYSCEGKEGAKRFGDQLLKLLDSQGVVGRPRHAEGARLDAYGEPSSKLFEVGEVNGWEGLVAGKLGPGDYISLVNLISLVLGHSMRSPGRLRILVLHLKEDLIREGPPAFLVGDSGVVYLAPLKVLIVVVPGEERLDVRSLFEGVERVVGKGLAADWAKVITVNDTSSFVDVGLANEFYELGVGEVAFDWAAFSTFHPVSGGTGAMMDLDEMGNYLAMAMLDGDGIGDLVKALSPYPGRFVTFSVVLNFAFSTVLEGAFEKAFTGGLELKGAKGECGRIYPGVELRGVKAAILYSGGDDLVMYGEWRDVISVLLHLRENLEGLLPRDVVLEGAGKNAGRLEIPGITVSGGIAVFKPKFPIRYAYTMAKELESRAKTERKKVEEAEKKRGGRVALNISENYELPKGDPNRKEKEETISLTWDELEEYFRLAYALQRSNEVPSAYLYKVYEAGSMADEGDAARALVTYAYLNERTNYLSTVKRYIECLKEVTGRDPAIGLPDYREGEWDKVLKDVMKFRVAVNMYSLMSRS
mgnify:CR=1 FL=1